MECVCKSRTLNKLPVFCPSPLCGQNFAPVNLLHDAWASFWNCSFIIYGYFCVSFATTAFSGFCFFLTFINESAHEVLVQREWVLVNDSSAFLSNILKPLQSFHARSRQSWRAAIKAENWNPLILPRVLFSQLPPSYLSGMSQRPLEFPPASNIWTAAFTQSSSQIKTITFTAQTRASFLITRVFNMHPGSKTKEI